MRGELGGLGGQKSNGKGVEDVGEARGPRAEGERGGEGPGAALLRFKLGFDALDEAANLSLTYSK